MKRFLVLALSALCAFTLFIGCNAEDSSSKKPSGGQSVEDNDESWTNNY